jgi:hypothetical protein
MVSYGSSLRNASPVWSRVLFALLSLLLLGANLDTAVRIGAVARVTGSTALLMNELAGSAAVVAIVALPWALGGLHPTREDLTWAILLAFAAGFARHLGAGAVRPGSGPVRGQGRDEGEGR